MALALASIGDARALPGLMKQVNSLDQTLRCWSAAAVRKLSGERFGFKDNATFETIEEAIPKIRSWWKSTRRPRRPKT